MEVRETAACGIAQRVFAIEGEDEDLTALYRLMRYAHKGVGFYDDDFLEDLKSQMTYIIGPGVEDEPDQAADQSEVHWEESEGGFALVFKEAHAPMLYRFFSAVASPGQGYDQALGQRLLDEALDLAPALLSNLPVINR